ncbi:MAG: hypothetical protein JJU41_08765 [Bacteroidetes bacterium]|nr:hypothetical protein [Bacteroidota bacterium]
MKALITLLILALPAALIAQKTDGNELRANVGLNNDVAISSFALSSLDLNLSQHIHDSKSEIIVFDFRSEMHPGSETLRFQPDNDLISNRFLLGALIIGDAIMNTNAHSFHRLPAVQNIHQYQREIDLRRYELNPVTPRFIRW